MYPVSKTLDEFFDSYGATKFLRENLQANMEAMGDSMTKEEQDGLMRVNLIMIRQCLQDFGAE